MHIEIGDHPLIDELRLNEVAGERYALRLAHLAWQGELDFAGELRVLAQLEGFDIVPEPLAVVPRLSRSVRQQHLGMHDAALAGEVLDAIDPRISQP
ncbi:hypothetical protein J2S75_000674 [Ancylobacter polymorphus]|uniref:Uncharacterized protein n=1 Tax=Ancylobacter polymorphus TaxID=223390 RepID=A0ABU0B761_9HYPH|nr:hypothetical protein [Ancylobacter polymorphus]